MIADIFILSFIVCWFFFVWESPVCASFKSNLEKHIKINIVKSNISKRVGNNLLYWLNCIFCISTWMFGGIVLLSLVFPLDTYKNTVYMVTVPWVSIFFWSIYTLIKKQNKSLDTVKK